jgi:DNA primase
VRILTVTGAKDPDEYIQKYGAQRFARLLDGSGSQVSYLLAKERRNFDFSIPEDKSEYLKKASAVLAGIRSPVEREVYVSRVAEETGISGEFIRAEIKHIIDNREAAAKKKQMREEMDKISGARDRINPEKSVNLKAARAEEGLIAVLLKHPDYYRKLEPPVTEEDFVTQFNRNIFRLMRQQIEQDGTVSISALAQHLTTDEVARLTQYTITAVAADNELRQACDYAKVLRAPGGDMSGQDPEAIRRFLEQNKKSQKRKE